MMRALALVLCSTLLLTFSPGGGAEDPLLPPKDAVLAPVSDDLEAIQETLRLPAATWYNDKDGDKVFDSLMARFLAMPGLDQPAIVTFVHETEFESNMAAVREVAPHVTPTFEYRHLNGFAGNLRVDEALAIAGLEEVRQVEWEQPGSTELNTATLNFGVDAVQDALGITGDGDGLPDSFTGEDVIIAIMDTGFDGDHVDLQDKFIHFIDWSDDGNEAEPYDSGNHGTHVASIAGGLGVGDAQYTGVAPGASFVGFMISTGAYTYTDANGTEYGGAKAAALGSMDWIIGNLNETPVRISTISFGFGRTVDGTDALELAMDQAFEAGVLPFKSCGNSGPEQGTVTIPGGSRGIMCVASMHDAGEGGFRLSSFSSRGPTQDGRIKPNIAAPGSNIMAASAGSGDGYVSLSGTSMASPFAAGAAALLFDADPTLHNDDVRRILIETADDWGPGDENVDYGAGRIDVLRAIQTALIERAMREDWSWDAVAALDVPHPLQTGHIRGEISGTSLDANMAGDSFYVENVARPLGITVIHDGETDATTSTRVIEVLITGPDAASTTLSLGPTSRQHTFSLQPTQIGSHSIEALGLLGEEQLFYDIAGPVVGDPLPSIIPTQPQFEENQQSLDADSVDAPGAGWLVGLAAIAVTLALLRRR